MNKKCPTSKDKESFTVNIMVMGGNVIVCHETLRKLIDMASAERTIVTKEEQLKREDIVMMLIHPAGTT